MDLPQVGPVRLEIDLADGPVEALRHVRVGEVRVLHHLARERVAVGVQAAGGEAQYRVTDPHALAGYYLAALACTYANADQIEVAFRVEARHLGRLPADEGDAKLPARLGSSLNDLSDSVGVEPAARHVVEEKKWAGTGGGHVVGAGVHYVRAQGSIDRCPASRMKHSLRCGFKGATSVSS